MLNKIFVTRVKITSLLLLSIGIISGCSYTKTWEGSVQSDHIHVVFKELSGKQKLEIQNLKKGSYMKYDIDVTEGKLNIQLKSASSILGSKQITGKEKDSIFIGESKTDKYFIILNGKKASGSVDIGF